MIHIGIIGGGFVGSATNLLNCPEKGIKSIIYDIEFKKCIPPLTTLDDIIRCDVIMIAVPTPMNKDGSCNTNIVEKVINQVKELNRDAFIIIRSTVPVGFCERMNVSFMPEFLTEANWRNDFLNCKEWIFGLVEKDKKYKEPLEMLFNIRFGEVECKFITPSEAELIKYFRNCFLSVKVSFCNEIYRFCQALNINYDNVINIAANNDKRIGSSHTKVPGPDKFFGYGGTCFPKDMHSLEFQMKQQNINSSIISASIYRNENIDRTEKDWENDTGRAVV